MSLPKEPRQKMINLMYLVLTALLALNVSSEILNAFKTVDRSLMTANRSVDNKDKSVMESFEELLKDPKTQAKAAEWKPIADQAQKMSEDVIKELEQLKVELKTEAGLGKMGKNEKGEDLFKEDDLEAATRLFIGHEGQGGGKGDALKAKLQTFKDKLLALHPEIKTAFGSTLPIDLTTPENKDWNQTYFHMTPTVAALTILSKFENDVKNSSSQVVEWCHQQVGKVKIIFNDVAAITSQSTEYTMPGEEITIRAGIGAFSKDAKPNISIDGASVALNPEGVAELKFKAGATGAYSKKVHFTYIKPDGTQGTADKEIKYTVGAPTGVNVSATAVNVLYRGIANPIAITGVGAEKIQASIDNGTLTKKDNAGSFEANPGQGKEATITVAVAGGKTSTVKFPVKRIPDPAPKVGPFGGGTVARNSFVAQAGIRADMGEFVFQGVKFNVSKYTIICSGRGFENTGPKFKVVDGAYFDGDVKGYLDMTKAGSSITIQDIWVEGPDGKRKLEGSMGFSLSN